LLFKIAILHVILNHDVIIYALSAGPRYLWEYRFRSSGISQCINW